MNEFGYIATTRVRTAERRVRRNPGRHIVDRRGSDRRDAAVQQLPALPGGLSHLVRALGVRPVRSTGSAATLPEHRGSRRSKAP
jgi:hypothetical protein